MKNIKRLTALDGLRGVAALGVAFFWHYQHFAPREYPFSNAGYWFYRYGFSLVDLFFVISGFVFCYVYKERISAGRVSLREFGILRFSRLYPLHFATLIIVAALQIVRGMAGKGFFIYPSNDVYHFILNVLFVQNGWFVHDFSFNAPSWSVSVELIAYTIFFAIVFYSGRKRFNANMVFILMILLGLSIKEYQLDVPLLNQETYRVFIGFFTGCLTYELNAFMHRKNIARGFTGLTFISFLILVVGTLLFGHKILGDWQTVYAIAVFPMGIILILNIKVLNLIFSLKPMKYLGDISYSIYLLHFPAQLVVKTLDDLLELNINYSSRVFFIVFMISTIAVSAVIYEVFEKPLQKYIRKTALKSSITNT